MSQVPPLSTSTGFEPAPENIPNHLVWAIVSTVLATCLCCGLGLVGIVAIVYSNKVNPLLIQGDRDGAKRASGTAKTWCWVATGLAIFGLILNIITFVIGGQEAIQQYLQQLR